jgi:single-strand DNA-binding protein
VNSVVLIGRIGQEPELKYGETGTARMKFSLAVNESWTDADGVKKEHTNWINCVVWKKRAEGLSKYLYKGMKIAVRGKLTARSWENEDGTKGRTTEVVVRDLEFFGTKKETSDDTNYSTPNPDDIPF